VVLRSLKVPLEMQGWVVNPVKTGTFEIHLNHLVGVPILATEIHNLEILGLQWYWVGN